MGTLSHSQIIRKNGFERIEYCCKVRHLGWVINAGHVMGRVDGLIDRPSHIIEVTLDRVKRDGGGGGRRPSHTLGSRWDGEVAGRDGCAMMSHVSICHGQRDLGERGIGRV